MLQSNERIVKHKIGLLNLAEELTNVSRACKIMGLSRDTFYRYKAAVEDNAIRCIILLCLLFYYIQRLTLLLYCVYSCPKQFSRYCSSRTTIPKLKNKNRIIKAIKCHAEFATIAMLAITNSRERYNGFRVNRNEPSTMNFVVGLLKLIAVLLFFMIFKALMAIRPEAINNGNAINKRVGHLLNMRLRGNSHWIMKPIRISAKKIRGGGIIPLNIFSLSSIGFFLFATSYSIIFCT